MPNEKVRKIHKERAEGEKVILGRGVPRFREVRFYHPTRRKNWP